MNLYIHHKYNSEIFWYLFHGVDVNLDDIPYPVLNIREKNIYVNFEYKNQKFNAIFCDDRLWDKKDGRHIIDTHLYQLQKCLINNRGWNDYFIHNHLVDFNVNIKKHSKRLGKKLDMFLIDWEGIGFLEKYKILDYQQNNLFLDEYILNTKFTNYPTTQILSSFLYTNGLNFRDFYYFSDFLKLKKDHHYKLHYAVRRPTDKKIKNIETLNQIKSDNFIITYSSYINTHDNDDIKYRKIADFFEKNVISKFKDDAVFNKRKYGIHNFGEETNNNNTREMLWKVLPFSEVEILDEYIEDGFITEKLFLRILAEKPFIPTNIEAVKFYENICKKYNQPIAEYPLEYKTLDDIVDKLDEYINDEEKWEELVNNITNWVKSLKTSIIKILDNNNSYLDFVINDVPTKKHTI